MTEIGYKEIIDRIVNRTVSAPPSDSMTLRDMEQWMHGYARCQHDIIGELMEGREE